MKDINELSNPVLLKELFKQLFNNSSDPLFITNTEFKLTECNTAFGILFQTDENFTKRNHLVELFENEKTWEQVLSLLNEKGLVDDYEVVFRDNENERLYVLLSIIPIKSENGGLIGYQGIVHDETERVLAQRQLNRTQRISMTDRMLRTIAHEIRNPLTNVNLAIASLNDSNLGEDDLFMVDLIQKNSKRINDLLSELLNSSKPSELQLEGISLQELMRKTILMAEDRMKLLRILLNFDAPEEPIIIQADVRQMTLALNNILLNAIESMPDGGGLTITIKRTSKRLSLSIIDTGVGMNEDTLNHLFDPFFSGKTSGTGLGLTATQNILQSHGWQINVDSEEGIGSDFQITIPV